MPSIKKGSRTRVATLLTQDEASAVVSSKEWGCALNAETFFAEAQKALRAGDYSGFLCSIDLAGQFARDAREAFYGRTFK